MKAAVITSLLLPALALARPGNVLKTRDYMCQFGPAIPMDCVIGRQYCWDTEIRACVRSGATKTTVTTARCGSNQRCYYVGGGIHDGIPACMPCTW